MSNCHYDFSIGYVETGEDTMAEALYTVCNGYNKVSHNKNNIRYIFLKKYSCISNFFFFSFFLGYVETGEDTMAEALYTVCNG